MWTPEELARRGTVAVVAAFGMVPLIVVMAVVLDGGILMAERRRAHAAADASALAAAVSLLKHYDADGGADPYGSARKAARTIASGNGFSGGGASVEVRVPPTSGAFAGRAGHAEVVVTRSRPRLFSALWGPGTMSVTARAVARGMPIPYFPGSLLVLDPSAPNALSMAGSGRVVTNSGIQVNSGHGSAVSATNTGYADATAIRIVGGFTTSSSGYLRGQVLPGSAAVADPLVGLPPPDPAALPTRGSVPAYGTFTMSPGVYNGGVSLGGGARVTMQPGIYYMKGGSFSIANGAAVTGHGVTIFVDNGGGQVSFQGGGVIDLSAAATGPYAGVLIYMDRNSGRPISIANGTTTTLQGTVYAPGSTASFAGGAMYSQMGSQYIVRRLDISNNAYVGINYRPNHVATKRGLNLVE